MDRDLKFVLSIYVLFQDDIYTYTSRGDEEGAGKISSIVGAEGKRANA